MSGEEFTVLCREATLQGAAEPAALVEAADRALYAAKRGDRNRVVTSAAEPAELAQA